jgi:hypothetical protein
MLKGFAVAAAPMTNRQLRTSVLTILPSVISEWPLRIDANAVLNSGNDVPRAIIVAAMTTSAFHHGLPL